MREAISNRISRRRYLQTPVAAELKTRIRAETEALNRESGLSAVFVEDAGEAFSSMRRSYGMFSGVRSALVLKGPEHLPDLAEKIGYYGERLVLDLTDMGLGTCWVGGTFDRSHFRIPDGEAMLCVVTVGYVEDPSLKERLIRGALSRKRKPASQRLRGYETRARMGQRGHGGCLPGPQRSEQPEAALHLQGRRGDGSGGGGARHGSGGSGNCKAALCR